MLWISQLMRNGRASGPWQEGGFIKTSIRLCPKMHTGIYHICVGHPPNMWHKLVNPIINYILFLYPILSLCITVTWPILDTLQKISSCWMQVPVYGTRLMWLSLYQPSKGYPNYICAILMSAIRIISVLFPNSCASTSHSRSLYFPGDDFPCFYHHKLVTCASEVDVYIYMNVYIHSIYIYIYILYIICKYTYYIYYIICIYTYYTYIYIHIIYMIFPDPEWFWPSL